jgi:hypothetical protein
MGNNKFARFHFELENGSPLAITYSLQPNSLLPKWEQMINCRRGDELELKIANRTEQDLPEMTEVLNGICQQINQRQTLQLPMFLNISEVTRDSLNYLHEEFENYGARHQQLMDTGGYSNQRFDEHLHDLYLKLNNFIHITESLLEPKLFPQFHCLVQYMPFEQGVPVTEEDKLFLDTDFDWGHLYLGYNTLGKDWYHAAKDNDQRLITNDQIKVQEFMSTEVWLNFSAGFLNHRETELLFWRWYKSLPVDLQTQIPIDNISKLALGKYYMGHVVLDRTFTDFHASGLDWMIPFSPIRKQWNLEVFRKIRRAVDIEIFEDSTLLAESHQAVKKGYDERYSR